MVDGRTAADSWVMNHQQSTPKSARPTNYNSENNNVNWNNAMDASQYPGYSSNYWYPQQSHCTGHYATGYPPGSESQQAYNPQAMAAYPNGHGAYNPGQAQYSQSSFHPSNPFYCAEQMPAPPRQQAGPYPAACQGCLGHEQSAVGSAQPHPQQQQHHHHQQHPYAGQHCQGGTGYPPGSYPHYGEGGHAVPQNPPYPTGQSLHPRPQAEAWAQSGGYGPSSHPHPQQHQQQPQQQWPPGTQPPPSQYGTPGPQPPPSQYGTPQPPPNHYGTPGPQPPPSQYGTPGPQPPPSQYGTSGPQPPPGQYGTPVRPQHPPAWPGTGTGAPPPYQPKEQHYPGGSHPHQHQRAPQVGPKPRPTPSPNPPNGKPVDFSSPPQLYNKTGKGGQTEPRPSQCEPPVIGPALAQPQAQVLSDNPNMAKVQLSIHRVVLLQEDVDEFVGKKTDKSYRYLEELLTKELLELDSVETQGQEAVRQARKEAVRRIQAILDQLEKKAF